MLIYKYIQFFDDSLGVGIFFVTQNPADVPDAVLGQLGLKIQHALRAFTAKDRKAIKLAAQNYPLTDYYDVEQLLTELGIGAKDRRATLASGLLLGAGSAMCWKWMMWTNGRFCIPGRP